MKNWMLCVMMLGLLGCATDPVDINLYGLTYKEDAPVILSPPVEAVTPLSMPASNLRALILPFAVRQELPVRKDIAREMTDIFRLTWLEHRVFDVLEYDSSRSWPGLAEALALARAKGANLLVSGNLSEFYEGGRTGNTSIGLTVEVHWVADGTLLWSAAQAATLESGPDKDFVLVRSSRRLPAQPTYAVMRTLAVSLAQTFSAHRN